MSDPRWLLLALLVAATACSGTSEVVIPTDDDDGDDDGTDDDTGDDDTGDDDAGDDDTASPPEVRALVLLVVDTMRIDALQCGAHLGHMPYLESLIDQGTCVERSKSTVSWTTGGTLGLLSGVNNETHGVIEHQDDPLNPDVQLAGDIVREFGWTSFQASANALASTDEIAARFDYVYNADLSVGAHTQEYDPTQVARLEAMLDEQAPLLMPESNFFLHVQLFSPHFAYCPPDAEAAGLTVMGDIDFCADNASVIGLAARTDPAVLDRTFEMYWGECAYSDAHIRMIMEMFEARGLLEHTVFALTADHGEELFEHGQFGHLNGLNWAQIDVPLAFWGPGIPQGQVLRGFFSSTDVLPTLLDFAGIPVPDGVEGRSLKPFILDPSAPTPYRALTSIGNDDLDLFAHGITATTPDGTVWTLINGTRNSQPLQRLYLADTDPLETQNLYGESSAAAAQTFLQQQLDEAVLDWDDWYAQTGSTLP